MTAAALVFNYLCGSYFNAGRTNIVYDAIYFIAGGLIFLYRKELAEFAVKSKVIARAILLIATVAYFAVGGNTLTMLFFCVAALVDTLGCNQGGDWSIQLPSSLAVSASRSTCATWEFIVGLRNCTLSICLVMAYLHISSQQLRSSAVLWCSRYVPSGS